MGPLWPRGRRQQPEASSQQPPATLWATGRPLNMYQIGRKVEVVGEFSCAKSSGPFNLLLLLLFKGAFCAGIGGGAHTEGAGVAALASLAGHLMTQSSRRLFRSPIWIEWSARPIDRPTDGRTERESCLSGDLTLHCSPMGAAEQPSVEAKAQLWPAEQVKRITGNLTQEYSPLREGHHVRDEPVLPGGALVGPKLDARHD